MNAPLSLFERPLTPPAVVTLRPYQERGIDGVRALLGVGRKSVLIVCPTGGGKTVIFAAIASGAVRKGKRVLVLAHRKELIDQGYTKLLASGIDEAHLGTILAGDPRRRPHAPVQVASVQTIAGRAKPPADIVIIDEAHHSCAASYRKILAAYPHAAILGVTATPCRADGRGLGDVFVELVHVATFRDLAADGFLVAPRVFTSRNPLDLSKLKTTGGDYNLADLDKVVNTRELVGDIVATWQARAEGRTTVVFASSVEHSRAIVAQFVEAGVAAEHLDGTTEKEERAAILARLASGETTVVSNMGVLTEGWDLPRCKCVVLARPTKSLGLYLQMAGRGLRPWENTSALLLDHAGCVLSHGFPQDDREWSLEAKKKKASAPPVRTCLSCYAALPGGTAVCTECGHVFESDEREGLRQVDGELLEVVPPSETPLEERRAWYAGVLENAARRGRKIGFARHRYREKFGGWPAFRVEERTYYPAASVVEPTPALITPPPQESRAIVAESAPQLITSRARRIDLASLLRTSAVPAGEFAPAALTEAWSL